MVCAPLLPCSCSHPRPYTPTQRHSVKCRQLTTTAAKRSTTTQRRRQEETSHSRAEESRSYFNKNDVAGYKYVRKLGEGSYGQVNTFQCLKTGQLLAVKSIDAKDSVTVESIEKEIRVLRRLGDGQHVVRLHDVVRTKSAIHMVMQLGSCTLRDVIKSGQRLSTKEIRSYMYHLLKALRHIHLRGVMHRDLKPENILIGDKGQLLLCDFGLCSEGAPNTELAHHADYDVVTVNYRAPELIFGADKYGFGIDMWSVGCIFASLLEQRTLFKGDEEDEIAKAIHAVINLHTLRDIGKLHKLHVHQSTLRNKTTTELRHVVPRARYVRHSLSLLRAMLQPHPSKRIAIRDALEHQFFLPA